MVKETVVPRIFFAFLFLLMVWTLLFYDIVREFQLDDIKHQQLEAKRSNSDEKTEMMIEKKKGVILENILTAEKQPEAGRNIFFIDTTYMKRRKTERPFTNRQACAVESAGIIFF